MEEQKIMVPLNLPKAELKLRKKAGRIYVWDIFRKKDLVLTREEWVRQHILHHLVNQLSYPAHQIVVEYQIKVNHLSRRCDGVVFGTHAKPRMIVECKEPRVQLDENIMHQVAQYNYQLNVDYILLTNGLQTITVFIDRNESKLTYLQSIPDYKQLLL